ncbi:MAG: CheB methylesterase [Candidatus Angelobacter sp.]|jgi:two-component system chemotaxis response regulator CheB|nr:CheB methylesterase [Candidatus Angelobacter sp.]
MGKRDIVVIGASAGGVQALLRVVSALPREFPASVFVVVHTSPSGPGMLDKVLNRVDGQRARYAQDGMKIQGNSIYIAPPDRHLLWEDGAIRIASGPKQNRNRPVIDALFRSAASAYGERVIGVVLTGYLDDGSSGLAMIKKAGGVAIVQDPEDAQVSEMPEQALQRADPDYCLPLDEIPGVLQELVSEPSSTSGRGVMSQKRRSAPMKFSRAAQPEETKELTGLTCPDCHGAIWEVREGKLVHFKCRVGHSYSPQSMADAHGESLERAMWTALKNLEENIALTRKLVEHSRKRNREKAVEVCKRQIQEKEKHALVLHALLDGKSDEMVSALDSVARRQAGRKLEQEASIA